MDDLLLLSIICVNILIKEILYVPTCNPHDLVYLLDYVDEGLSAGSCIDIVAGAPVAGHPNIDVPSKPELLSGIRGDEVSECGVDELIVKESSRVPLFGEGNINSRVSWVDDEGDLYIVVS